MSNKAKGFGSMDPVKRAAICSKGGKAAHAMGKGHQWTSEEAREAGRKGGQATHARRNGIATREELGIPTKEEVGG